MSKRRTTRRAALLSGAAFVTAGWIHGGAITFSPADTLAPSGNSLSASVGVQFSGVVCTFSCSNLSLGAGAFSALINWSDTSPSTTGIVSGANGQFSVSGSMPTTTGNALVLVLISVVARPAINTTASSEMTVGTPAPAGTLRATITYLGSTYIYDEAAGTSLGSYTDPAGRFTESCYRVTRADFRLRVDFRRLSTGNRVSVVFGLGYYNDTTPVVIDPYTVVISGTELTSPVTISVPHHASFQRWRWVSAPWPFAAATASSIYSAGLLPTFNGLLTRGKDPFPGADNSGVPIRRSALPILPPICRRPVDAPISAS
jgi:hypothetical protein